MCTYRKKVISGLWGWVVFLSVLYWIGLPGITFAESQPFRIVPAVIDLKGNPREIIKTSVTLRNGSTRKLSLYITVNNVAAIDGRQEFIEPSSADLSSSLANWIEITRGVIELPPGGEKTLDINIDVNLRAKPRMYHALLAFMEGVTRAEAEAKIKNAPTTVVNLEVMDDAKERLQLRAFAPSSIFVLNFPIVFTYILENNGNRSLMPAGEIRIFNRRGEEMGRTIINQDKAVLAPNSQNQLASALATLSGFGRYKAFLNIEYGEKQRGAVQDTIFFWVIPWQGILLVFGTSLVFIAFLVILLRCGHRRRVKN